MPQGWRRPETDEPTRKLCNGPELATKPAWNILIAKYRRPIISFMYRMVRNQAVAEELAQEVFLRVYRARATYRAEARFSTWLYRIASNMAINHARDTKYERDSGSIFLDQADEEYRDETGCPRPSPDWPNRICCRRNECSAFENM